MNLTVMKNTNDILGLARNTFSALLICAMPAMASAQTYVTPVRSDITPPTPQSEAIMAVQAPQPDLLTGAVSLGVPLYTINVDGVECPLSLQYQTNGITVLSDPVPLGYGWSLMPALRITRTVLGRPDEKYPFSGDPLAYQEPNAMCYMCAVNHYAQSFTHKERYDSEHDIVNISLPGKSLTRVMEATEDTIMFTGACDREYRVEADRNLNTITVTDHYDNLGRKTMTENGNTGISQHFRYDAMGRMYASSMPSADAPSSESDYAMTYYERSPRGVVVSTVKNGETWHRDGKTVRVRTLVNTATGSLSAPLYRIGPSGTALHSGNYGAGQLLIEETVDENGHVSRTYTSKSGLVVMSEEGDGNDDMLRTRNIYDDYGRLRYVLPPSFADGDISTSDESFINNCYEFAYDACGRLSSRSFPGATAPHLFVYSEAGRTVAEHTPSMTDNEWLVYFYDRHGRQAYTANAGLLDVELEWHRQDFPVAEFTGTGPSAEPRQAAGTPTAKTARSQPRPSATT